MGRSPLTKGVMRWPFPSLLLPSFPGQPSLWARRRKGPASVLKQFLWISNLQPSRFQGVLKGIRLADNRRDPGSRRARVPWSSLPPFQVPGPCELQTFESPCALQRAWPGPRRDSLHLGSLPSWLVLPGWDHEEEGVG